MKHWQEVVKAQVEFIEEVVEQLPDTPTLLYAIAPPPEALPRFFPVLHPEITEPLDADSYVAIVKQMNDWRGQLEENYKAMEQVIHSEGGPEKELFRDMFDNWVQHQRKLVKICNNLLQHHIVTHNRPPEKLDKLLGGPVASRKIPEGQGRARPTRIWLLVSHCILVHPAGQGKGGQ